MPVRDQLAEVPRSPDTLPTAPGCTCRKCNLNIVCVRWDAGAIPATRNRASLPICAGYAESPPAGDRFYIHLGSDIVSLRSDRPTHPGSNFAAQHSLDNCHHHLVNGYARCTMHTEECT